MEKLTFEQVRDEWCKSQGTEGFEDYCNSLTISHDEYQEIAELYASQWNNKC